MKFSHMSEHIKIPQLPHDVPSLPHAGILQASQHSQNKKNEFQQYLGCVLTFPN